LKVLTENISANLDLGVQLVILSFQRCLIVGAEVENVFLNIVCCAFEVLLDILNQPLPAQMNKTGHKIKEPR
jgi:hypothetical protein